MRKTRNATRTRFQFTHPLRGATSVSLYLSDQHTVFQSTHSLRGATGGQSHPVVPFHPISIHAPLAGCDSAISAMPSASPNFNPRTPCGVRQDYLDKRAAAYDFNPRTPCGVRRRLGATAGARHTISIHAPLAGCDGALISRHLCDGIFQSTHPLRGATQKATITAPSNLFQSTHPLRGATATARARRGRMQFQSTHPLRGATRQQRRYVIYPVHFNPRTPCGVRLKP